jgi:hypothetical protein
MEEAEKLVGTAYTRALGKKGSGKQLEMRFYLSTRKAPNVIPGAHTYSNSYDIPGGRLYDALQPYSVNSDNTCSPIGAPIRLPKDIVLVPTGSTEPIYTDSNKRLSTIRIDSPDFGEDIVFYDLSGVPQIPEDQRTLVLLRGKFFLHVDNSVLIQPNIPGFFERPSLPVINP